MGASSVPDLVIQSHRGAYPVRFGRLFEGLENGLPDGEHLIIDSKVADIYYKELASALESRSVLKIEAKEANKSIDRIPGYVTHLLDRGVRRNHRLTAIGGGIIQDITAFIAATLLRGLPWRFFPTTLLAQADSCIGSKSSINVGSYKNQMGTFTPPDEVAIATEVLRSLDDEDLRSGIGEMIKVHIISGQEDMKAIRQDYPRLFEDQELLARYIFRSLEIKKSKIEADEFDRGERLVMNYGHSFGHAIETITDYRVPHGIAVTLGMDLANYMSCALGFIGESAYNELHGLLSANYGGWENVTFDDEGFFAALARDKKNRDGLVSLVLMRGPGELFIERRPMDANLRGICAEYFRGLSQGRPSPIDSVSRP